MVTALQKRIVQLEQQCSGVSSPQDMGTTGLIAWVCTSRGANLWNHFRTACTIIQRRGLPVDRFMKAVTKTAPDAYHRELLERYSASIQERKEIMFVDQQNLTVLPRNVVARTDDNATDPTVVKWSGSYPIPQIGQRVTCKINHLGPGVVQSYFIAGGYLGVRVKLEQEPEWKQIQHKGTANAGIALVYGLEISV